MNRAQAAITILGGVDFILGVINALEDGPIALTVVFVTMGAIIQLSILGMIANDARAN